MSLLFIIPNWQRLKIKSVLDFSPFAGYNQDMNKELETKLCSKYPKIFNAVEQYPLSPFPLFGFECDNGWYLLLDQLFGCIQGYIDNNDHLNIRQVVATQVKEKFGTLRFYYNGGDNLIEGMVWLAYRLSGVTCEHCGTTDNVTQNTEGWISTLCDKCRDIKDERNAKS